MEKDIVCSLVLFDLSADYLPPVHQSSLLIVTPCNKCDTLIIPTIAVIEFKIGTDWLINPV
jgi:hypothetical protein